MFLFIFAFVLPSPLWAADLFSSSRLGENQTRLAQAGPVIQKSTIPKVGCSVIDVHCICENPHKDYWIRAHKVGRINPGDEPECRSKVYIDSQAKKAPIAFCLWGESGQRDSRKGQSSCKATWECKKECEITSTIK